MKRGEPIALKGEGDDNPTVEDVKSKLREAAQQIVNAGYDDDSAHFNVEHVHQLQEMAEGKGITLNNLANAYHNILKEDWSAEFEVCPVTYAGNALRVVSTFDQLVDTMVPDLAKHPRGISVPEIWGDGTVEFGSDRKEAQKVLVGTEFVADGSTRYVRISFKDTSLGEVYRLSDSGAGHEAQQAPSPQEAGELAT